MPGRTILLGRDELEDDTQGSPFLFLFYLHGLSGFPVFALGLGECLVRQSCFEADCKAAIGFSIA